jgi:hypothetical protein
MNKQMTLAEIDVPVCGHSAMSVKERFMGLDKFDTLLGPNEESISPQVECVPNWVGTDQKRYFEFGGDRLTLKTFEDSLVMFEKHLESTPLTDAPRR